VDTWTNADQKIFLKRKYRKHKWFRFGTFVSIILLIYVHLGFIQMPANAQESDPEILEILEQANQENAYREKPIAQEPSNEVLDALDAADQELYEEMNQSEKSQPPESDPETLEALEQKSQENMQSNQLKQSASYFQRSELRLDLPSDTVLASLNGAPFVYVDEFNYRAKPFPAADLFEARYRALKDIIDTKLVAVVAREKGFEFDPAVRARLEKKKSETRAAQDIDQHLREISDEEIKQYYLNHIEKFRQPDTGTRVLFVVKPAFKETIAILKRLNNGEPMSKFSFSSVPIPGTLMPTQVQNEIFHLEPGQMTGVIGTPIGYYIAQLVERTNFNHFKVSIIAKNSLQECQQILKRVKTGVRFESQVSEKEHISVNLTELPEQVQRIVPGLELKEVSQPINTPLGYVIVKLQERWSDAEIVSAKLIRVNSEDEGYNTLDRINKGLSLQDLEERKVSGKELPAKLREAAQRIKEGEYSSPIKTLLGYYLVKVEERTRIKYKPPSTVKNDIKRMIKAEKISDEDAYDYYISHLRDYRKSTPDYFADIILAETYDQAENIIIELEKAPIGEHQNALFAHYQKDFKNPVSTEQLPAECQAAALQLDLYQLSPVVATHLGHFIFRLRKIEDPAYLPFEHVQLEIKSLLMHQVATQMEQKQKRAAQISITSLEDDSLAMMYYRDYLTKTDTVSDEEAEEWWQNNKDELFALMGIQGQGFKISSRTKQGMMYKKLNVLTQRHLSMIEDLYIENDVVIHEHLLYE
jgi:parvulin-like peptidyl-prolyl isomerase